MYKAFSFNREFDFVRLDGLRRATGRPPHEWDVYVIKELLDNALDADEALWLRNHTQYPLIHVNIEYTPNPEMQAQHLFVEISNRAQFPVGQIQDIFHTKWYTSRKAFIKGLTRGALGNALKTLLGIPYALHNRVAGDWKPLLNPMSIRCGTTEYLPRYQIDALAQQVHIACEPHNISREVHGTVISLGIDNFQQEQSRTIEDIIEIAQQYHLCNPHASFSWNVTMGEQAWAKKYLHTTQWVNKFHSVAPIHWYSLTAFQDVLGALYRIDGTEDACKEIALEDVYRHFIPFDKIDEIKSFYTVEKTSIVSTDIEGPVASRLYRHLLKSSPRFDLGQLGYIGLEHIQRTFESLLELDSKLCYQRSISNDPDIPFVMEAAVARTKTGKRQIWAAMNFSPTYDDPFRNRHLTTSILPEAPIIGLRGFLDAYNTFEDSSVILFLHLICPNIEHQEFSKTEIDHLPFKDDLGKLLDEILTELRQQQEAEELQLEATINQVVATILSEMQTSERFTLSQLLEQVRIRLYQHQQYTLWLDGIDVPGRLQSYVVNYLSNNALLAQSIAQPARSTLAIPLHPDHHFHLAAEHVSQEVLTKHYVNKILYIQEKELEAVALENNWLCLLDMALLQNPQNTENLQDVMKQCVLKCNMPIMIWHNADEKGNHLVTQIQTWFKEEHLNEKQIIDLGLFINAQQSSSLMAMMPGEQLVWLRQRFRELAIPEKAFPHDQEIRQDLSKRLEQLFFRRLLEHLRVEISDIFSDLDQQLYIIATMISQKLDAEVKKRLLAEACTDFYDTVAENVVQDFFRELTRNHSTMIQQFIEYVHIAHPQS